MGDLMGILPSIKSLWRLCLCELWRSNPERFFVQAQNWIASLRSQRLLLLFVCSAFSFSVAAANVQDPRKIFSSTPNDKQPSRYWLNNTKPFPTNAWFINFAMNRNSNGLSYPVTIFPYSIKTSPSGIHLSYTAPIFYSEPNYPSIISAFYYQFDNQLTLGSNTPIDHYGLVSYHGLRVTLGWEQGQQKIIAPIVQGSPYVTEFFTNTPPKISTRYKIKSINQKTTAGALDRTQRFELTLALDAKDTQTWLVYSEKPLIFNWISNAKQDALVANEPYTGWIRLVLQKDTRLHVDNDATVLDTFSQNIPLDYQQDYHVGYEDILYSFSWQTQNNNPPLILSLPHQRSALPESPAVQYQGIKGLMSAVDKARWDLKLPKIPIVFLEQKDLSVEQKTQLRSALKADVNDLVNKPFPDDGPYQVGKRCARAARLILIAQYLKEDALQQDLVHMLQSYLKKKMANESGWQFQYDTTWGGIIPSIDDYGARHYNDHHFHYGYWVYTFAVIAQVDSKWLNTPVKPKSFTPKQWIEVLIRDYANENSADPYFPKQRYQDDYVGHSWASGLTAFVDGQNQQSSSEAVFAYYAMALYAMAVNDQSVLEWAHFLSARELVSAQTYWQIPKDSAVYSESFKEYNQVVGNLWDNKIDANAFFVACQEAFRCGLEYAYGIQMLPFTAITSELLNKKWLRDSDLVIKKLITNQFGPITPAWKWILIKGVASIMNPEEKASFLKTAIDSKLTDYDHGDSKTNTLYFLM